MATKTKETCIYTDSRLDPYEGNNTFKIGTSMCTGCGTRVDSVTGEPVEGLLCPINSRAQPGINAETSQEMIAQVQQASDKRVEDAVAATEAAMKAAFEGEKAGVNDQFNKMQQDHADEVAGLKEAHARELKSLKEEHESTLEEIAKKHDAELKKAQAAQPKS